MQERISVRTFSPGFLAILCMRHPEKGKDYILRRFTSEYTEVLALSLVWNI